MISERRYPILLIFLKQTLVDITDEIIEMFDAYKKSVKHTQIVNPDNSQRRKLKGIEAVNQQPGGPPKDIKKANKDDFDSAWDDALSED